MKTTKGRVLMAMSGGIDSSVAAVLLHNEGYEVIGLTMKTWDYELTGNSKKETGCCNLDTINDARAVAVKYGFPHYVFDVKEVFYDKIVKNFISEYMSGFTPNPCVLCNTLIKWDLLLKKADALNCDYIATGHYARIRLENGRYILSRGIDASKDQSYVLWGLTQENLKRTIFPLGEYKKEYVRKLAIEMGHEKLAVKRESYEICFIPDDDYRSFIKLNVPDFDKFIKPGNFVDVQGNVLGQHKGFPNYTIGQRKGLEVAVGYPLYVKEIDVTNNIIVLCQKNELEQCEMYVDNLNLIKYEHIPSEGIEALVKIRYKDAGTMANLIYDKNEMIKILFYQNVSAITPGQSAVFMDGDDIIGGGIIKKINNT
ncbi:MAG: tRNA 2-thiouridine(34) synthase MnmA [Bacteroidales bacterium]|nr:tRNA 2-thiouridine(34) synthase MnmA [Bacteroidales bacterium]